MALYAFDGTGNEDREGTERDSNALDFFNGYDDSRKNHDPAEALGSLYLKGIGRMAQTEIGRLVAEGLGLGGHTRVRTAMKRLKANLAANDRAVDIVGFSRGAALAMSFANRIAREHPDVKIRFIGVWDIVGEFGLPGEHLNAFHDLGLPDNVEHCYHAMALDEGRLLFPLSRLKGTGRNEENRLVEVWFRGVHSDVGGGNGNAGLNWIALNWMFENARRNGLPILDEAVTANLVHRDALQQISDHKIEATKPRMISPTDLLHASVRLVPGVPGRPHNNPTVDLARIDDAGQITRHA